MKRLLIGVFLGVAGCNPAPQTANVANAEPSAVVLPAASTRAAEPGDPVIGMANPASVYCVKLGGRLEIRKTAKGEAGYCHLPDGRVMEEWALYRGASYPEHD